MSPEVATFLLGLVSQATLSAGADDFETVSSMIVRTKRELKSVIDDAALFAVSR